LLADALRVAAAESDPHPYGIEAVRTTIGEADRLNCGSECHTYIPPPSTLIYLVVMRGHFACNTCKEPPGARLDHGTVITLECLTATPSECPGFGFSDKYPKLRGVGIPVRL